MSIGCGTGALDAAGAGFRFAERAGFCTGAVSRPGGELGGELGDEFGDELGAGAGSVSASG